MSATRVLNIVAIISQNIGSLIYEKLLKEPQYLCM
jgi:hypothetical protein